MYINADGSALPCCIGNYRNSLGNVQDSTVEEIWNNEEYKKLRYNMINGIRSPHCEHCYISEDSSGNSPRQDFNKKFEKYEFLKEFTHQDGYLEKMDLKYLDIRWSNICNLKCRTCCSTFSSSWAKEDGDKNVYIFAGGNSNDELYRQFEPHFTSVEEFYFAGGEPLLTDKHYDILERLIDLGKTNVKLRYNTNLTKLKFKNKNVLDLWKYFENVEIFASLDHYGTKAEYIREGTNWKRIEENIKEIKEVTPHVALNTNTVVSVLNVFTITDFFEYMIENNIAGNNYEPTMYCLIEPEFYSFSVLNDNLKQKIIDKLRKRNFGRTVNDRIDDVILNLENTKFDKQLRNEFLKQTALYDKKRNRDFWSTFPELKYI